MRVQVANLQKMREVPADVPDAPIQQFIQWLLSPNRFKVLGNPELLVEKATKLRSKLVEATVEVDESLFLPSEPAPAPPPGYAFVTLCVPEAEATELRTLYPEPWDGPVPVPE